MHLCALWHLVRRYISHVFSVFCRSPPPVIFSRHIARLCYLPTVNEVLRFYKCLFNRVSLKSGFTGSSSALRVCLCQSCTILIICKLDWIFSGFCRILLTVKETNKWVWRNPSAIFPPYLKLSLNLCLSTSPSFCLTDTYSHRLWDTRCWLEQVSSCCDVFSLISVKWWHAHIPSRAVHHCTQLQISARTHSVV